MIFCTVFPVTFTTTCTLSFPPTVPFLPVVKTFMCRTTGNGWKQEKCRDSKFGMTARKFLLLECGLALRMYLCQHFSSNPSIVKHISSHPFSVSEKILHYFSAKKKAFLGSQRAAVLPVCLPLLSHRPYHCKSSRKTSKAPLQQTPTTTRRLLTAPASLTSRSALLPTAPGRYTPPASWAAPPLYKEAPSGTCQLQMVTPWPRHRPTSASTPSSWT